MFHHFRILPFVVGIVLGIVGIYYFKPQETVLYKYPTPENAGHITYRDKNGVCYKYTAKEVDCDSNQAKLKQYPLA